MIRESSIVCRCILIKNAFEATGKLFESRSGGIKVSFNLGASGDFARRIEGGVPVSLGLNSACKKMHVLFRH